MKTRSRRRAVRKVALAVLAAGVLASTVGVGAAGAATSSTLLYSTDGGATWTNDATVAAGGTVLVRQWFDNDGADAETAASVATQIPDGFTLQGGSTEVCLNPTTTDPANPDPSHERCIASNEGSVWSGSNLQVSPGAGHYGESNGSTVGELAHGRPGYLNLHQCVWTSAGVDTISKVIGDNASWWTGTGVSNSPDAAASCFPGAGSYALNASHTDVAALDLLGNRYLNLHQCSWSRPGETIMRVIGDGAAWWTGTEVANSTDAAPSCYPGAGSYALNATHTDLAALDLLGGRYLNLHQCAWTRPGETLTRVVGDGAAWWTGTEVSDSPDAAPSCFPGTASWIPNATHTDVAAFDLLDTERGAGYVTYAITAPPAPTPEACADAPEAVSELFDQDGTLTSTPSGVQAASGTITVDWSSLEEPCPVDPIPLGDPIVVGAGLAALAGAGYVIHRRRQVAIA